MKRNDFLDILKFVLSLMIVAVHAQLMGKGAARFLVWPYLRLAVPLFFIMAGYFVFTKVKDEGVSFNPVRRFASRNYKMYIFWFVVFLPFFLRSHGVHWIFDPVDLFRHIRGIFVSGYGPSWFILAAIEGLVIIYFLSRFAGRYLTWVCALLGFAWACVKSSYWCFLSDLGSVVDIQTRIEIFLGWPQFTFFVSMIWILCGKEFAEGRFRILRKKWFAIPFLVCSMVLFWLEWFWVWQKTGEFRCDAYFLTLPVAVSGFGLLLNVSVSNLRASWFRNASIAIYMIHGYGLLPVHVFIKYVLRFPDPYHILEWIGGILFCLFAMSQINKLRKKEGRFFRLLRYAW